jgi:molybdopterin-binding protein
MKVSARNTFKGTVRKIIPGAINAEVLLEIVPGVEVNAIITKTSVENLNLTIGQPAYVMIKSSDVILAVD